MTSAESVPALDQWSRGRLLRWAAWFCFANAFLYVAVSWRYVNVLASPDSVDDLAAHLRILSERSVRAQMSQKALALRLHLSMRRHAREIFEIYQSIAVKK